MPGLDKTGPTGQGSQTGRNLGMCGTENSTNLEDRPGRKRIRRGYENKFEPETETFFHGGRGLRNGFRGRRGNGRNRRQGGNTNTNE